MYGGDEGALGCLRPFGQLSATRLKSLGPLQSACILQQEIMKGLQGVLYKKNK